MQLSNVVHFIVLFKCLQKVMCYYFSLKVPLFINKKTIQN